MKNISNGENEGVPEVVTFKSFCVQVEELLGDTAGNKGYNFTGPDGHNIVYEFIHDTTGDHGHGIGEIIYKAIRFMQKRNPDDLLKLAAWSYLVWRHHYILRKSV
jgi:hypothetical protein